MAKSKMIAYQKNYLFNSYVGTGKNIFGRIWCEIKSRYWNWRLSFMSEGEVIKRYYALTTKTEVMDLCHRD